MKTKYNCSPALLGTALISILFSMPALAADETGSSPADQPISSPVSTADAATICKDLSGDARLECLRDHQATTMDQRQNADSAATPVIPAPPPMNADCSQMSDSEKEACEKASRENAG